MPGWRCLGFWGVVMSENSAARTLFINAPPDFTASGASGLGRYLPAVSPHVFAFLAAGVDLVVLTGLNISLGRLGFVSSLYLQDDLATQSGLILIALLLLYNVEMYRVEVLGNFRLLLRAFAKAWAYLLTAVLVIDAVSTRNTTSDFHFHIRNNLEATILWCAAGGLALLCARYSLTLLFRYGVEQELLVHDVVVVGATELAAQFIARVRADRLGVRVKAVFDEQEQATPARMIAGVPVCGDIDDLLAYHKRHEIDTVVVALPLQNNEVMRGLVRRLSPQPLKIALLPGPLALETPRGWRAPLGELPGVHLMSIRDLPIERSGRLVKAVFDKLAAGLALLLFGPVMLGCALGIKLTSPGPVLFRQPRIGYRNREFNVFKFRSMHVTACNTGKLTVRNDPRIFVFGQLMRKLSLDELPQLFNVLLGDMSMVGPRPHMAEATAAGQLYFDAVQEYAARHRVKPGITGWAQVNGWRGPTVGRQQIEQRVAHDLYYIDNWSFILDLKILVKTAFVGFFGKNAF